MYSSLNVTPTLSADSNAIVFATEVSTRQILSRSKYSIYTCFSVLVKC